MTFSMTTCSELRVIEAYNFQIKLAQFQIKLVYNTLSSVKYFHYIKLFAISQDFCCSLCAKIVF